MGVGIKPVLETFIIPVLPNTLGPTVALLLAIMYGYTAVTQGGITMLL